MQKVLIIQTAFIGDVVLSTAMLEKIHSTHPHIQLDILVRKGNESLFVAHPYIREVLIWDKKTNKYNHLWELLKNIRGKKYDIVVTAQRFAATGFLTAFSKAKQRVGFRSNPFSFFFTKRLVHTVGNKKGIPIHEIDRNQLLIAFFTDDIPFLPKLYPSQKDVEQIKIYQCKPYYCIAPASVFFTKQLPMTKWVELIQQLRQDWTVYLIGAHSDISLCIQLKAMSSHQDVQILAGKLNFLESAALMRDAEMNYTNDSAPMHIASAMNAPITAIFCSTVPLFGFGPLSIKKHIIECQQPLPCRPCNLHGKKKCPKKHFACAYHIRFDKNNM